jgi:hypothetical protein
MCLSIFQIIQIFPMDTPSFVFRFPNPVRSPNRANPFPVPIVRRPYRANRKTPYELEQQRLSFFPPASF